MRLRREDDRLNLTCELTSVDAETGKIIFTMTSQPKTGLDSEDFLGAVIKCITDDGNMYATLTSVCSAQTSNAKIISACGKLMIGDKAYELAFTHTEAASGTVTENIAFTTLLKDLPFNTEDGTAMYDEETETLTYIF